MKTPNLFLVGAPKCGPTTLYTYLRDHPQIYMSPLKEPQYFAEDLRGDRRRIRTLEEYRRCFAGVRDEAIIGEASTAYLASPLAAQKIKAFSPDARLVIMLRNPVDKMYSRFNDARFNNREPHNTFEAALAAEETNGPSMGLGYLGSARYVGKLETPTCLRLVSIASAFPTFPQPTFHFVIDIADSRCNLQWAHGLFRTPRPHPRPRRRLEAHRGCRLRPPGHHGSGPGHDPAPE